MASHLTIVLGLPFPFLEVAVLETLFDSAQTEHLYHDLRRANSEAAKKERFLTYVTTIFRSDDKVQGFIRDMAMGAETSVANIIRDGRTARGRADSQTDAVIIEWERDLARTGDHARDQLKEYLEGRHTLASLRTRLVSRRSR